jgi:hypothetical protein
MKDYDAKLVEMQNMVYDMHEWVYSVLDIVDCCSDPIGTCPCGELKWSRKSNQKVARLADRVLDRLEEMRIVILDLEVSE